MFNPGLMEKVVSGQQSDRMRAAEIDRLLRSGRRSRTLKLKTTVIGSGLALIGLLVIQLL